MRHDIPHTSQLGNTVAAPKKRKLALDSPHGDVKRSKPDINRRRALNVPRRSSVDVLEKLLNKSASGDRQMAVYLLREFSDEHLPSVCSHFDTLATLLLKSAALMKYDQISSIILQLLLSLLSRAEVIVWSQTLDLLLSDEDPYESLLDRVDLDAPLLSLVAEALNRHALSTENVTARLTRCSDRALRCSTSTHSRRAAVHYLVAVTLNRDSPDSQSFSQLEQTMCQMTSDRDARVRCAAVDGLVRMTNCGSASLTQLTYDTVKTLIHDSDRHVRIEAMRIILSFANKSPSLEVASTHGEQNQNTLPLCDDAFSIICHGINDMEVLVRAEAAKLLGQFTVVSDSFLDQTLDKKLMYSMKTTRGNVVKRNAESMFSMTKPLPKKKEHGRWKGWQAQKKNAAQGGGGEWASGKDLNAPCPTGDSSSARDEADSIIPQGACGAFVTALEDEFMAVRKAAVYSLGRLAAQRPSFATTALDHLADMFNDEIAEVRLDAIYALTPLVVHGQLQKEQLEIVLKCLDDAMFESRQALRELLAKGEFADVDCMKLAARALINCLQRFPSDKDKIFECMSELGKRHGVFVHTMVRALLDLHPVFDTQEQQIDDVFYTAKLILVLNAASQHEPIISILPEYVLKHYRFMRAAQPHLVAPIKVVDSHQQLRGKTLNRARSETAAEPGSSSNVDILLSTYERLCDLTREHSLSDRNCLRRFIVEDANAISAFNAPLSASARFLACLSELCAALESIQQTVLYGGDMSGAVEALNQELLRVKSAQHQFTGIHPLMMSFLIETEFHIGLLAGLLQLMRSPENYAHVIQDIRMTIQHASDSWQAADTLPSDSALLVRETILNVLDGGVIEDGKKILTAGSLGQLLSKNSPQLPGQFPNIEKIQAKWAEIVEPGRDVAMEKAVKFVAGLPTAVTFRVNLHNFSQQDVDRLRIQIDYPDNTRTIFRPRKTDFKLDKENNTVVSTKVLLSSSSSWLDSAAARLTVVLMATGPDHASNSVPVLESPASRETASIRVRLHPMNRT